ncbi:MAG: heliorhodopsin HeR [Candidatus Saccharibacteria bacterium]
MKPRTKIGVSLQKFNRRIGLIHLIQGLVLLAIFNRSLTLPVLTRFLGATPEGVRPVTETLFQFPVAIVGPLFLLISAFFHFLISSPMYIRTYENNIKKGMNPMRWIEYSISSSLMLTVLLMLGGLLELPSVIFIFTLNLIMNMMGLEMERYNQYTTKTAWFPFNVGVLAGIVPWIVGGIYFWVSTNHIADSIPGYAKAGFLLTFIFFNTFAINMWLQYKKIGPWKDYLYGEKAYIWLSLTAKTSLAWILVLGTINQVAK